MHYLASTGARLRRLPRPPASIVDLAALEDGTVLALHINADGRKPPQLAIWNVEAGSFAALDTGRPITGGGGVAGRAFLTSASGRSLAVWKR